MRKSLVAILVAVSVAGVSGPISAAEPSVAPAVRTQPTSGAEKAGRFVTRFFEVAGSALEWTGRAAKKTAQGAGRGVTNLLNDLEARRAAKP